MLTGSDAVPYVHAGMSAFRAPGYYPGDNTWRVVYSDRCSPYEFKSVLEDTSWVAGQWLSFLSVVIGGAATLFLWTSTCLVLRPNMWTAVGVAVAAACLLETCSLVWFYTRLCHTTTTNLFDFEAGREVEGNALDDNSTKCTLFFGSKCSITAITLWAAATLWIFVRGYPNPVPRMIVIDREEKVSMVRTSSLRSARGSTVSKRSGGPTATTVSSTDRFGDMNTNSFTSSSGMRASHKSGMPSEMLGRPSELSNSQFSNSSGSAAYA